MQTPALQDETRSSRHRTPGPVIPPGNPPGRRGRRGRSANHACKPGRRSGRSPETLPKGDLMRTFPITISQAGRWTPRARSAGLAAALAVAAWALATVAASPAAQAATASAGAGAGGDFCVVTPVSPGSALTRNLTVTNVGTSPETITISVAPAPAPAPLHPPLSRFTKAAVTPPLAWITPATSSVTLGPGESTVVPVTLNIPGDARPGDYQAWVQATAAGQTVGSSGGSATLGGGSAVTAQFAVNATPPVCNPKPASDPWWAEHPQRGADLPPGWSFGGPASQPFVWTYRPTARASAAGEPPGWTRTSQMQVWLTGGWDFIFSHTPGWRYLASAGPLGVVEYIPPSGKLPSWTLRLAAGLSYTIPGTPGSSTSPVSRAVNMATAPAAQPAAQTSGTGISRGAVLVLIAAAAGAVAVFWRRRRRLASTPRRTR